MDLGIGGILQQQSKDALDELRKKRKRRPGEAPQPGDDDYQNPMSPAAMSVFGRYGGYG